MLVLKITYPKKRVTDIQIDLNEGLVSELKLIREGMKLTKGLNIFTMSIYNSI